MARGEILKIISLITVSLFLTAYVSADAKPETDALALDKICFKDIHIDNDPYDAEASCERAAKAGAKGAQYAIGLLYYTRNQKDLAVYWLEKSAEQGHTDAIEMLEDMRLKAD